MKIGIAILPAVMALAGCATGGATEDRAPVSAAGPAQKYAHIVIRPPLATKKVIRLNKLDDIKNLKRVTVHFNDYEKALFSRLKAEEAFASVSRGRGKPEGEDGLILESVITELKIVSKKKRLFTWSGGGQSSMKIKVRLIEADSGRRVFQRVLDVHKEATAASSVRLARQTRGVLDQYIPDIMGGTAGDYVIKFVQVNRK